MKKDHYLRARGGSAQMIYVICSSCKSNILFYQKDGVGWLKRCYLNRIFGPDNLEKLQYDPGIKNPGDIPNLICKCGNLIGSPMRHKDGRLAYHLIRGNFMRKKCLKKETIRENSNI